MDDRENRKSHTSHTFCMIIVPDDESLCLYASTKIMFVRKNVSMTSGILDVMLQYDRKTQYLQSNYMCDLHAEDWVQ